MHSYVVTRTQNYTNLNLIHITEIKYERDFVLFFDVKGLQMAVNSDTVIRIERT
jgi:hypothetical protein